MYVDGGLVHYSIRDQLRDLAPSLLGTLIMMVCVFLIGLVIGNTLIRLLTQIVIGIVIYGFYSVITKNDSFNLLIQKIKSVLGSK